MDLTGRRSSQNVEDRRRGGVGKTSMGIGGLILVGVVTWLMGGNPLEAVMQNAGNVLIQQDGTERELTAEELELSDFASKVLAGTEDVWSEIFRQNGLSYSPPKMVLFSGSTSSSCGAASSQTGPFYCSADQAVYLDLSFFKEMKDSFGAEGDFASAYVIAHEVGHHVQYLLGTLDKVHQARQRLSEKDYNKLSVRLELQADYYAGLWAHHDNKNFHSMQYGDLQEGLNAAHAIGDDRLQMNAQGYVVPDAFNHGTSAQRSSWLKKGYEVGTLKDGDTFSLPDPTF